MIPQYVDIHSHISFPYFDDNREEVLARMEDNAVGTIVIGVDVASSKQAVTFSEKHEHVWASIGHHPHDTRSELFNAADYTELVKHPKVVVIGECGLDYFRKEGTSEDEVKRQKDDLEAHIAFAVAHNKPLMLHCRPSSGTMDAYRDALEILTHHKKKYGDKLRGNFHFFVGNIEVARKAYELGFTTSFSGVITFAPEYEEVVAFAPLTMIHAETDAPYAAPVPHRGKQNEPVYVKEVVAKIAALKNKDEEEVRKQLLKNAKDLFEI